MMVFHEEEHELSTMAYENLNNPSASNDALKSHSDEDSKVTSAAAGVQLYRLVAVSFGVICVLQTTLIIYLSLAHSSQNKSLTEEKDALKDITFGIEASNKNLTEERDEHMRKLDDLTLHHNSLTEERDEIKKTKYEIEATNRNLTEERDELKRKLNDFALHHNSLTEERDEIKKTKYDIEASLKNRTEERDKLNRTIYEIEATNRNLTEERDELKRKLNDFDVRHRAVTEERDNLKAHLKYLGQQGWVLFRGSAYYVSSTKTTWQGGRNDCIQRGADLMIINSEEKQNFANQLKRYMWIGLTDSAIEGTWKWVDGTRLTTSYWTEGEPNGRRNENCANIKSFDNKRSWNDELCSTSLYWVCEMKLPE
ncbi:uncharacterized protein LOC142379408 isoform X1 [Odontesthes bonariensis]|uniref:uncharacterized protein LOC142379408 isoform X1 n=1 Tax=Odontesthes bonariensis TaxID=219752 RepID=UPI003F58468A